MKSAESWVLVTVFKGSDLSNVKRTQVVPLVVLEGVVAAAQKEGDTVAARECSLFLKDDEDELRHLDQFKTFPGFPPAK